MRIVSVMNFYCFFVCLHAADCCEQRADHPGLLFLVIGLTADLGFRASRRLNGGARRAALGLRAGDHGASRARAGRALTDLTGLVTGADTGRAGGNRGLENVTAHIGRCGALRLEHVAAHVGLRRAGRDAGFEHVLGPVDLGALDTAALVVLVAAIVLLLAAAVVTRSATIAAGALSNIYEPLVRRGHAACDHTDHQGRQKQADIGSQILQGHHTLWY
jgi:hypothetical protein